MLVVFVVEGHAPPLQTKQFDNHRILSNGCFLLPKFLFTNRRTWEGLDPPLRSNALRGLGTPPITFLFMPTHTLGYREPAYVSIARRYKPPVRKKTSLFTAINIRRVKKLFRRHIFKNLNSAF